jgi:bis(5'-nucleosyl)-tetraphosphatase (symmetrical)
MRAIVIGDIHGCLDEFDALLAHVSYQPGKDRLILLGDLVDRGPDSHGVLRRAQELRAAVVLGNHDEKHLRWHRYQLRAAMDPRFKVPMRRLSENQLATHATLTEQDFEFIGSFVPYLFIGHPWVAVHGGLDPIKPIEEQDTKQMVRRRYIDPQDGKLLKMGKGCSLPPHAVFWAHAYNGPEHVIYGHNIYELGKPKTTQYTVGIDTGCVFGGGLTAGILVDGKMEVTSVPSRAYLDYQTWLKRTDGEH